jgi:ubiquinone biosynthesis protein
MLSPRLIPTRLVDPSERAGIVIAETRPPSRLRSVTVLLALLAYAVGIIGLRLRGELDARVAAVRLRGTFEELAGLWLKVGQLLSLRIDLFPQAFCQELARLQSRAEGFPTALARQIIEQDLGASIETYYAEFEDKPFAVASIGQVHRAKLRQEGVYVAVKVQKPYARETFQRDLVAVRWIVRFLRLVRFRSHMRWDLGYDELCEVMKEELDFHYEASSVRRMRKSLRAHRIYVPRLFSQYCSPRVLVTEFIHAVLMADYIRVAERNPAQLAAWLTENKVHPRKVARRLIHSIFRQLLEDNLYHGDLHPGNIVLLRNDRIALIDFGSTNFTEREYLSKFGLFVRSLAMRDYAKAADLCLLLTAALPNIDTEQAKEELVGALRSWATRTLVRELPYHDKSIDNATIQVVKILVSYRCTMAWAWLRIHRALTTLDTSLIYLYSDVNYTRMLQSYFQQAEQRRLKAILSARMAARTINAYATALDIQDRVNDYTLFQGMLVRRHAQVVRGATSKVSAIWNTFTDLVVMGIAVTGVAGLLLFLEQRGVVALDRWVGAQAAGYLHVLPVFDTPVWGLLLAVYVYVIWTLLKLRRRLGQKDARGSHERVASV